MKGQTTNVLLLIAVVAVVGGVAWFKMSRSASRDGAEGDTAPVAATPQKGELCPDPPTTAKADDKPTTVPASVPTPAKKLPRIVDLGADKCKACKDLAPILEQLRKEYDGRVTVDFIDVWKNPRAGDPYKIRVIPTQVFYDRDGKEVWRHEGFLPKADFVAKFAEFGVK
jgi:thioredoxin 1